MQTEADGTEMSASGAPSSRAPSVTFISRFLDIDKFKFLEKVNPCCVLSPAVQAHDAVCRHFSEVSVS